MNSEIESIWYQMKCNGFNQYGGFPTERTVIYTVGEQCVFGNNKQDFCELIVDHGDFFSVDFKKHTLSIPKGDYRIEVLYKKENGNSKKKDK